MTLDDRIKSDLDDLYNSGILTFIQQFRKCKIKMAEQLSMDLFGAPNKLSIMDCLATIQASVMLKR